VGEAQVREQKEPDRLAKAINKRVTCVTVEDRELRVRKWNLHTSLELMSTLGDILKKVIASVGPKLDIGSFLQQDIGKLMLEHEDNMLKILAGSIAPGNFEDVKRAKEWISELGAGDALRLFAIIAKQNIRPLVEAVGEIAKEVAVKAKVPVAADRKVSRPGTSSPSS
jgi:hypothetical protein